MGVGVGGGIHSLRFVEIAFLWYHWVKNNQSTVSSNCSENNTTFPFLSEWEIVHKTVIVSNKTKNERKRRGETLLWV